MNDNFDMLIVDVDSLRTVDPLYLIDQVLLDGLPTENLQYLLRIN